MTATLQSIINRALSQVGGYFPGKSPYGMWYDDNYGGNNGTYDSAAFCAMGLSWVFTVEGAADIFPIHAYTPSGVNAFKSRHQWHNGTAGIQPGDILYFKYPGSNRVSHVALALSHWRNGVDTVEFNTSGHAGGDQRNGRTVARKRRTSSIVGYGRPVYASVGADVPPGDVGADAPVGGNYTSRPTADIQRLVGATPDGVYGPDTTAKVKTWQAANGLTPDGDWGPLSDAKGFPPAAADSVSPFIIPTMSKGSETGHEALWQSVLTGMGFKTVGAIDGIFGDKTAQATKNFQAAVGLVPDGVAGPLTVSAALLTDGDRVLAEGDSGADVLLLQWIVGASGDSVFGPQTKRQTQAVQRWFGVNPDGVVGPIFVDNYRRVA